jgi:signal transduction histidine kinase
MVELINLDTNEVWMNLKNKGWLHESVILGVLLLLLALLVLRPFTLMNIFFSLLAIYVISSEILKKHHEDTLAILMGISLLTGLLIWTIMDTTSLTDFSNLMYLITALSSITGGILGWMGLIPEWFRSLGS